MTDNISKIFDIASPNTTQQLVTTKPLNPIQEKSDQDLQDDYQSSIEDYTTLMDQGKSALGEILSIATESQNARFFEAAALMIKTLADTNAGRMDVHHKLFQIRKMKQDLGLEAGKTTIEKAVFIGSTAELLKQVKPREIEAKEESEIIYDMSNE